MGFRALDADTGLRRRRNGSGRLQLLLYGELPEWMKDNEYIHGKYRPSMERLRDCLRTAFFNWHNESVNIWSHFLGFLFFLSLTIYTALHLTSVNGPFAKLFATSIQKHGRAVEILHHAEDALYEKIRHSPMALQLTQGLYSAAMGAISSAKEVLPKVLPGTTGVPSDVLRQAYRKLLLEHRLGMLPMLLGATMCCLGSALYHALWNHSSQTMAIFSRLDYCGIVFLIAGHSMMGAYYMWYCRPRLAYFYSVFVGIASLPVFASFAYKRFELPEFRSMRALLFLVFGFIAAAPAVHSGLAHRFIHIEYVTHVKFLLIACAFYLTGALVFATRWPERKAPGRFDTICNSHQLLHVCVIVGAFLHWYGSYISLVYRLTHGCANSPL
mmetsp:Transcript_7736/g.23416  ORF Transcript_7736/g.23416 Transcript_7736/m.23416 type:complete len:384 (+) Transcript_7736:150-1301(+)